MRISRFSTQSIPQLLNPNGKIANASSSGKKTIESIRNLYRQKIPLTMMTAHDYPSAHFLSEAGIDICLVGDSLAMVALGYESTLEITLDEMMHHSRAVQRGCVEPFLVGDMPFGTYESCKIKACDNAIKFMKQGRVEAVKLEGGVEMAETISKITRVGIPVMGHVGLTPQRASSLGGFKAQGRTLEKAKQLIKDAIALQEAGCFSIVLEAIPDVVASYITKSLKIPTIGIGSGVDCSGQVLVQLDALGVYDKFVPKFSKLFGNIGLQSVDSLKNYANQVKNREFPENGVHTYKMMKGEQELFLDWIKNKVD